MRCYLFEYDTSLDEILCISFMNFWAHYMQVFRTTYLWHNECTVETFFCIFFASRKSNNFRFLICRWAGYWAYVWLWHLRTSRQIAASDHKRLISNSWNIHDAELSMFNECAMCVHGVQHIGGGGGWSQNVALNICKCIRPTMMDE